jgi:hypothetical protein
MGMTMPQNVIYLPPGVVPPAQAGAVPVPSNIPFDRTFFEAMLPQAIKAYCEQVHCTSPQVQVATLDGSVHHVVGISGVTDGWVAVHATREDHAHAMEIFLPYQTIYRVEIHPEADADHRHLGFSLPLDGQPTPAVQPPAPAVEAPKERSKPAKKRAAARS